MFKNHYKINEMTIISESLVPLLQEDLHAMGDTNAINVAAVRMFANRTHRDDVVWAHRESHTLVPPFLWSTTLVALHPPLPHS